MKRNLIILTTMAVLAAATPVGAGVDTYLGQSEDEAQLSRSSSTAGQAKPTGRPGQVLVEYVLPVAALGTAGAGDLVTLALDQPLSGSDAASSYVLRAWVSEGSFEAMLADLHPSAAVCPA